MEYETASQYRTQGKMILLINEWIGVLWGFRQQQWQLWSVMTGTSSASQLRTPALKPMVFIMKPIAQMNISNFPRVKQQMMGLKQDLKAGLSLPSPLYYPVVTWSPQNQWEWGQGWGGERISGLQAFRLITNDGDLMEWGQWGEDTMILLILKVKLSHIGMRMTLVFFLKNRFDPKCRRTLAHSLKTIRDDWWAHAEMVIFPLLSTSLFVKSLRGEKWQSPYCADMATFK